MAIIVGAKISTKIGVLANLGDRVDMLWVGGAMATTFLRAQGLSTGRSLVEDDFVQAARGLLESPASRHGHLALPTDVVVSESPDGSAPAHVVAVEAIPDDMMVVDIGPDTAAHIAADGFGAGRRPELDAGDQCGRLRSPYAPQRRSADLARGVVRKAMRVLRRHLFVHIPSLFNRMLCQPEQAVSFDGIRLEQSAVP